MNPVHRANLDSKELLVRPDHVVNKAKEVKQVKLVLQVTRFLINFSKFKQAQVTL